MVDIPYLVPTMLNKYTAGVVAIILGGFGVHRFYLGQRFMGILRFAAFVFAILVVSTAGDSDVETVFGIGIGMLFLSAFIEGLVFLIMPQDKFDAKYNKHHTKVTAPANVEDLKIEGADYFRSGDYDLAAEAFLDALDVRADDPGVHFNLACTYAKTRNLPLTLHHLELAISYGLPQPERIEKHPVLEWVRTQPMYVQFRKNNYRQVDLTKATAPAPQPMALKDLQQPAAPAEDDLLEQLRTLGSLRERGILTDLEFVEQKEKLLG